jgi:hypothetical protein
MIAPSLYGNSEAILLFGDCCEVQRLLAKPCALSPHPPARFAAKEGASFGREA